MPRVSKNREVSPEKQKLFIDDFYSAVTSLKDKKEVRNFFEDLLTSEEKLMLGKRFQIAMMLRLGYLWEEIDDRVKITQGTIAGIYHKVERGLGGLAKIAERIIEIKRKKKAEVEKGFSRGSRVNLGPKLIQAGIGLLIQERKRLRKEKSIVS